MAAGWARTLGRGRVDVHSGGSKPASDVNPVAVAAMAEVGIDVSDQSPKPWTDEVLRGADVIVTMGCGDACPIVPGTRYEDWDVTDPAGLSLEDVRAVRDDIGRRVKKLLEQCAVDVESNAQS